jgi:micrococcal nuclease
LAVVVFASLLLVGADRAGFFGSTPLGDMDRYDGRTFTCVKVVDGDTLDIAAPDGGRPHTRIRLWGVDTPETVKPNAPVDHFGPEASRFTREQTLGRPVRVELLAHGTRDKYGRLLAYVHLPDGTMLNRRLVAGGYGYADPRFEHRHQGEFSREMRAARDARRGLWQDVQPHNLPHYLRRP